MASTLRTKVSQLTLSDCSSEADFDKMVEQGLIVFKGGDNDEACRTPQSKPRHRHRRRDEKPVVEKEIIIVNYDSEDERRPRRPQKKECNCDDCQRRHRSPKRCESPKRKECDCQKREKKECHCHEEKKKECKCDKAKKDCNCCLMYSLGAWANNALVSITFIPRCGAQITWSVVNGTLTPSTQALGGDPPVVAVNMQVPVPSPLFPLTVCNGDRFLFTYNSAVEGGPNAIAIAANIAGVVWRTFSPTLGPQCNQIPLIVPGGLSIVAPGAIPTIDPATSNVITGSNFVAVNTVATGNITVEWDIMNVCGQKTSNGCGPCGQMPMMNCPTPLNPCGTQPRQNCGCC